jgi:hypothetical protein
MAKVGGEQDYIFLLKSLGLEAPIKNMPESDHRFKNNLHRNM